MRCFERFLKREMKVYLERTERIGFTEGVLIFPNRERIITLERPYVNNEPFISCIPKGVYKCHPYDSPRFGRTHIVEGGTVSKFPSNQHNRYGILFHPANTASQLAGCIAPVSSLTEGGWGAASQAAFDKFKQLVGDKEFMLFIS